MKLLAFLACALLAAACTRSGGAGLVSRTPTSPAPGHSATPVSPTRTQAPTAAPTNTRTPRPTSTEPPTTPTPAPSHSPGPSPTVSSSLSEDGPWLIVSSESSDSQWSIWALNPDGGGLTQLVDRAVAIYGSQLQMSVSPAGGLVAFVDEVGSDIPRLRLLSLGDRTVTTITSLMPAGFDWSRLDQAGYQAAMQTYAAVTRSAGAWSRDGTRLALVGAMDGPSSDLYLYSVRARQFTRLTDGSTEAVLPIWSPDERYILHGAAADLNYGASGAGYDLTGMWAARPDGSGAQLVYPLDYRGFERVLRWGSNTTFLVDRWEFPYGYSDLRMVDIQAGQAQSIWQPGYAQRAYDPHSRTVLFEVPFPRGDQHCDEGRAPGVYLLPVDGGPSRVVPGVEPNCLYHGVSWSEGAGVYFVITEAGVIPVTTEGRALEPGIGLRSIPSISPDGSLWAVPGKGLWIGTPEAGFRTIADWNATPLWRPDGGALLLFKTPDNRDGGFDLYLADAPEFAPRLVVTSLQLRNWTASWVQP